MNILTPFVASLLFAITESRSIHKRSDDPDPLVPVVDRLVTEVAELKAHLGAVDRKVAFSVRFSSNHLQVMKGSAFKFDHVIFNDGDAYDRLLGIFTAPIQGLYTFTVQVFTLHRERPLVDIRINGNPAGRMALDTDVSTGSQSSGEDSGSMTVMAKLNQGDRVWVESFYGQETFWGDFHTFFNGALLYAVP